MTPGITLLGRSKQAMEESISHQRPASADQARSYHFPCAARLYEFISRSEINAV